MSRNLVALAAALALAVPAVAATLAGRAPDLASALNARLAQIPSQGASALQKKEKSALTKAIAALGVDNTTVAQTVANAAKAVKALDKVYPPVDPIGGEENVLLDRVQQDVSTRGGEIFLSLAKMPAGAKRTKAAKALSAAEASITAAGAAPDRAARAKALAAAAKSQDTAAKLAAGSGVGPKVTTTQFTATLAGDAITLPAPSGPSNYTVTCSATDSTSRIEFLLDAPSGAGGRHQVVISVPDAGPGTHDLDLAITSYRRQPDQLEQLPAISGSVTFTSWDAVNGKLAGTMSVTFSDGTATATLTDCRFSTTNLVR